MTDEQPIAGLGTEQADERFASIDAMSSLELATVMNEADADVPAAVAAALPSIAAAVDAIVAKLAGGGRLIYVGAGTSGRLGVLDASECPPTFGTSPDDVVALIAGGERAVRLPVEGAEDDEAAGAADVAAIAVGSGDVVVGIASSGRTPYVLAAVAAARRAGAVTIGLSCNGGAPLSAAVDHPIEVIVGPEVVAGSTRLKAGTAQKLVLNTLSTVTMVRLGKTYGNRMIDLRVANGKLRERAAVIVADIADVDHDVAVEALVATEHDVKAAVVVAKLGVTAPEASDILAAADGRLRDALDPRFDTDQGAST